MLSYQILKDRYEQLQNKYKASQKEWHNEINKKDKYIKKLILYIKNEKQQLKIRLDELERLEKETALILLEILNKGE